MVLLTHRSMRWDINLWHWLDPVVFGLIVASCTSAVFSRPLGEGVWVSTRLMSVLVCDVMRGRGGMHSCVA